MVKIEKQPRGKRRILVVEDSKQWQDMYKSIIEGMDATAVVKSSADEAIEALKKEKFNGVIMDGLEGDWEKVHGVTSKRKIPSLVISGSWKVERSAESKGVSFVSKGLGDVYGAIEKITGKKGK